MPEIRRNNRSTRDRFNRDKVLLDGYSRPNRNNDRRDSSRESRGECLTLRIEKMVQGGEGMARLEDGRVCFVAGALPGELCKVRLTFQKKDFTKGRVVEVLEASPDRVEPRCPLYGKCGGCSLQHLASEKQADYLEKVERENFKRLAHAELPEDFVIHTGDAWGYRNRARVVFRGNSSFGAANREGSVKRAVFGFRGEESNNIVPFDKCLVLTDGLNDFLRGPAATLLTGDSKRNPGGFNSNPGGRRDVDVNIFDNGAGEISFYYPGMHKSEFDAHAVSHVEIAGREIEADASVFFQSNLGLLPELVNAVRKAVDEGLSSGKSSDAWLIDLFSGVGFFACILQDKFKKITTVEREEGCLKHARINLDERTLADSLQTTNAKGECCRAAGRPITEPGIWNLFKDERIIENVSAPAEDWLVENVVDVPATLIVDPPRTGLPKEALTAIVKSSVNRLIYVSCDPVTLARDFAKFSESGFTLSHAEGFAFYPQTPHLEMMFVLDR
jgi:23S rRNA (uracil1939-C5)-methyltransferase